MKQIITILLSIMLLLVYNEQVAGQIGTPTTTTHKTFQEAWVQSTFYPKYYKGWTMVSEDVFQGYSGKGWILHSMDYEIRKDNTLMEESEEYASMDNECSGYRYTFTQTGTWRITHNHRKRRTGSASDARWSGFIFTDQIQIIMPTWTNIPDICTDGSKITLTNYVDVPITGKGSTYFFSGKGVIGNQFDPGVAGEGSHTITLDVNGYKYTTSIRVYKPVTPAVSLPSACWNTDAKINLASYFTPTGGTFKATSGSTTIPLENGRYLNPSAVIPVGSTASDKNVSVTYTIKNGPCSVSKSSIITVKNNRVNITFDDIPTQCNTDAELDLNSFVTPSGGTFSCNGLAVNANRFLVLDRVGTYTVKYSITKNGYTFEKSKYITVRDLTRIDFDKIPKVCSNSPITLMNYVTPRGGVFIGDGITNNVFYPETAGLGLHTITYTYTNTYGCVTSEQKVIEVVTLLNEIVMDDLPTLCLGGKSLNLRNYVNTYEGSFYGPGVNGDVFEPSSAGEGLHTITFNYTNGSCETTFTKTIEVLPASNITWYTIPVICYVTPIDLSTKVSTKGGVFSGPGVNGNIFDPVMAGIGTHTLNYKIQDPNGCEVSIDKVVIIDNLFSNTTKWLNIDPVCEQSSTLYLPDYMLNNSAEATFKGRGVTSNYFNPVIAGPGTHVVAYELKNGSCSLILETAITVTASDNIVFNPIPDICTDSPIELSNYVSPQGGTFSGAGIDPANPTLFHPKDAGIGSFTITYDYVNKQGCSSTKSTIINVTALLSDNIVFSINEKDMTYCNTVTSVNLRPFVNTVDGVFSGPGVTGDFFSPFDAGVGVHKLKFTVKNESCSIERYAYISVEGGPQAVFAQMNDICYDTPIDLSKLVTPKGGKFSGAGVAGNMLDPVDAGIGTHKITYTLESEIGCQSFHTQTFQIINILSPSIAFDALPDVCINESALKLSDYLRNSTYDVNSNESGIFKGKGVDGEYFNPNVAGNGTHTISYEVGNTGCKKLFTQTITVNGQDDLVFNQVPDVCYAKLINLNDFVVYPGTFTGPGVSGNTFDSEAAGIGEHVINYKYDDINGCSFISKKTITVRSLLPETITFQALGEHCNDETAIALMDYINVDKEDVIFSGSGVDGKYFNPTNVQPGTYTITAKISSGYCASTFESVITINKAQVVTIEAIPPVCNNQNIVLSNYVSIKGGIWSGYAITGNTFDVQIAGIGLHPIQYEYDYQGCITTVNTNVEVVELLEPVVFNVLPDLCANNSPLYLSDYISPATTGKFTGEGVQGNYFNPAAVEAGPYTITFETGNDNLCKKQYTQTVVVHEKDNVVFNQLPTFCSNQTINLMDYVTHKSGMFSGPGVSNNEFSTTEAGQGNHLIVYNYVNSNGCNNVLVQNVYIPQIYPTITFNELPDVCVNDGLVPLHEYVDQEGGLFSGLGVQGTMFDPSLAGVGTHKVVYKIGDEICTQEVSKFIVVLPTIELSFDAPNVICNNEPIDLATYCNQSTATFSGKGVTGTNFDPVTAGLGAHKITCSITNAYGCTSIVEDIINVKSLNPVNVSFDALPDVCENGLRIDLRNFININESYKFEGPGVQAYYFYPELAGTGTHEVICNVGLSNECITAYKQIINVLPLPTVTFNNVPEVCFNTNIDLLQYVDNKYGVFSGAGVNGNILDVQTAGVGEHVISYEVVNESNCKTVVQKVVTIKSLFDPAITFNSIPPLCENSSPVLLSDYVTTFIGQFTGTGVSSVTFNPSVAGIGTHEITYTVGTGTCIKTYKQYITVLPAVEVTFSELPVICQDQEIDLNTFVNRRGGSFSGAGVTGNILNTAPLSEGDYVITYTYDDPNGCITTVEQTLTIYNKNMGGTIVEFNPMEDVCLSSSPIDLSQYVNNTDGTFTGAGVTGKMFNPVVAGSGVHLISYTVGNGVCAIEVQQEVIVKDAPAVTWHTLPSICRENDQIDLMNYVSHKGGSFAGQGIENGILKRSLLSPGIFNIQYFYETGNGCTVEVSTNITIGNALPDQVIFNNPGNICVNGGRINMFEFVNCNGVFSGAGINQDGLFDPQTAGIGEHRIGFTYGNGTCENTIYEYINVTSSKNVEFYEVGKVCSQDIIELSDYVNYKGGDFSGRGVSNNVFNPIEAGEGVHTITYVYKEENCSIKLTQSVEVLTTRQIILNVDRSAVSSSALVRFYAEGVNIDTYEWTFGDGGYSYEDMPFHYYYHTGDFDVTLKCIDTNGCKHEVNKPSFISVSEYEPGLKSVISINDTQALIGTHYEDIDKVKKELNIFPNPFNNQITITLTGTNGVIGLYNVAGQLIHNESFENTDTEKTINTSELLPGIYIMKVDNQTFKLVKK